MSRNGTPYHRLLNTSRWRYLRGLQLDRHPSCADCAQRGVLATATDVHHVMPVETGATPERMAMLCYDEGNLVSLCHACHAERHRVLRSHSRAERERRAKAGAAAFWDALGQTPGGVFEEPPPPPNPIPNLFSRTGKIRRPRGTDTTTQTH